MSIFEIIEKLNEKYREAREALYNAINVYHLPLYECNSRINIMKRIEHALYNMILASSDCTNSISTKTDYKARTTTITDIITGEIIIVPFIVRTKN